MSRPKKSTVNRGRRRPAGAEVLMSQVKEEFTKKRDELGARKAADELGVCVASFYNYINRVSLPDMEVLRTAQRKWHIRWKYMDLTEIFRTAKIHSPEQMVFSFLDKLREDDVEICEIGPDGETVLRLTLKIRLPA